MTQLSPLVPPRESRHLATPALLFWPDRIRANLARMIEIAGSPGRLWPHIKTHKCRPVLDLFRDFGIQHCKAATLEEVRLAARTGIEQICLANPLIEPTARGLVEIAAQYPEQRFYGIYDDPGLPPMLDRLLASLPAPPSIGLLLDLDVGQGRTGVPADDPERLRQALAACRGLERLDFVGFHVYDGHNSDPDPEVRLAVARDVHASIRAAEALADELGLATRLVLAGGTPSFACHAGHSPYALSPGTAVLHDASYAAKYPELGFVAAALLLTRVISRPRDDRFTLDLGYKSIAADPPQPRGRILGHEGARVLLQNEEHWVWHSPDSLPALGEELLVQPWHICPTVALHGWAWTVEDGRIADRWPISARHAEPLAYGVLGV